MSNSSDSNDNLTVQHDHIWNYFKFYAQQGLLLFRFYIIFVTFFLAGSSFLLIRYPYQKIHHEVTGITFSIIFFIITFVFDKLNQRNQELLHNAKEALKKFEEEQFTGEKNYIQVFNQDQFRSFMTHKTSYQILFILGYVIAILFALISAYLMCYYSSFCTTPAMK